jgi:hypothetical protein
MLRELSESEMRKVEGGQGLELLVLYLISPALAVLSLIFGIFW